MFYFLILLLYIVGVSYYDWSSWYTSGYQLGVQGRYFLPRAPENIVRVIILHML